MQYQPQFQQPQFPQPQPRHRVRNGCLIAVAAVFGLIVVAGLIGALATQGSKGGGTHPTTPVAANSPTAPASSSAQPPAAKPVVLAAYKGEGIKNTARFTAPSDWTLKWSYRCPASFGQGNFVVSEDGGSDISGANVDELGKHGHGLTHVYGDAGRHYLAIDSECSWKVTVQS